MGRLKTGIQQLNKQLDGFGGKIQTFKDVRTNYADRVTELGKKCDEGYDVMYLYLIEKFKKNNTTVDKESGKTLKEIFDSEIKTYVTGIVQWAGDLKKLIARLNQEQGKTVDAFLNDLKAAETQATDLKKIAEKKKAKWLKSKTYKSKQKAYIGSLDEIIKTVGTLKSSADKVKKIRFDNAWVDKNFKVTVDMTVKDIKDRASMSLMNSLKTYEKDKKTIDSHIRTFRDSYKSIPGQLALMKKWVNEADEMESL